MDMIRTILYIVSFPLLFTWPVHARAADSKEVNPSSCIREGKTLTRVDDYVIIHGKTVSKNLGRLIGNLSLLAASGKDGLKPVPFQVDEIDSDGEWVLTEIPPALRDTSLEPDRDDDNGRFDQNDELAFMIRDSGHRIREECYPHEGLMVDEIMLEDPVNGGKAWAYLCSFPSSPPISDTRYVRYDVERDRIFTSNYEMRFPPELPIAPGYISLQGSENILDQMKIRLNLKILGVPFYLDETRMVSELSLFRTGPIRIIRRTRSAVKFTELFRTPSLAIENIYYQNASIVPVRLVIPFHLKWFKKLFSITVRVGADFQNMHGWRLRTNCDTCWVNIDGKMDETEKNLKGDDFHWFVTTGPRSAFMIRMIFNRNPDGSLQETPVTARLYYMDDDDAPDPPEFIPGQSPNLGWWMENLDQLSKGTLYFFAIMYCINNYTDGTEEKYVQAFNTPVRISSE